MPNITNIKITPQFNDGIVHGEYLDVSLKTSITSGKASYFKINVALVYPWSNNSSVVFMNSGLIAKSISSGSTYTLTGRVSNMSETWTLERIISLFNSHDADLYDVQKLKLSVDFFDANKRDIGENSSSTNAYDYDKFYLRLKTVTASISITDASTTTPKHTAKYGAWIAANTPTTFSITEELQTGITYNKTLSVAGTSIDIGTDGNYHLGSFPNAGDYSPVYTVSDLHGNTYTFTGESIHVLNYSMPHVATYSAERCALDADNVWNADDDGGYIWHTLNANVHEYPQGNAYTVRILIKPRDSALSSYTLITGNGVDDGTIAINDGFGADDLFSTVDIAKNKSHYVAVEIVDWFGNSSGIIESSNAVTACGALFDIEENGVSVGMVLNGEIPDDATDKVFECAYPAIFYNGITVANGGEVNIDWSPVKIGKFCGEDLYRCVFTAKQVNFSTTEKTTTIPGGISVGKLLRIYGYVSDGTRIIPLNTYYSSSYYANCYLISATQFRTKAWATANTADSGRIVMEYTLV